MSGNSENDVYTHAHGASLFPSWLPSMAWGLGYVKIGCPKLANSKSWLPNCHEALGIHTWGSGFPLSSLACFCCWFAPINSRRSLEFVWPQFLECVLVPLMFVWLSHWLEILCCCDPDHSFLGNPEACELSLPWTKMFILQWANSAGSCPLSDNLSSSVTVSWSLTSNIPVYSHWFPVWISIARHSQPQAGCHHVGMENSCP